MKKLFFILGTSLFFLTCNNGHSYSDKTLKILNKTGKEQTFILSYNRLKNSRVENIKLTLKDNEHYEIKLDWNDPATISPPYDVSTKFKNSRRYCKKPHCLDIAMD